MIHIEVMNVLPIKVYFVGEKMKLLSEIHPGNYVFYDLQQEMVFFVLHFQVSQKVKQ